MGADVNPVTIAKEAVAHAIKHGNDPVILDTAGRLHIDEAAYGRALLNTKRK